MIQDPKISGPGVVSYSARYDKDGKLIYFYVADWIPNVVKSRLLKALGGK